MKNIAWGARKESALSKVEDRVAVLEKLINSLKSELRKLPEGNLRIIKKQKSVQYFHISEKGDTNGTYIKAEAVEFVSALAKKSYYQRLLREAEREYKAITTYIHNMKGTRPEDVYSKMSEYRQKIVTPLMISDSEYCRNWENEAFETNDFRQEERVYETKRGDKVRSKSEAIIADMYYEMGIPYRYEAKIWLNNGKARYPDFTLLKMPEREVIYHEHMGLMEDADYRRSNLLKIQDYMTSGIYLGKNLILTFETEYAPLTMKGIRKMTAEIFGKKYRR